MISSLKTDLSELKELIKKASEAEPGATNSSDYQVYLDLMTNFPIRKTMSTKELISFYKKSVWMQSLDEDSNFGLFNCSNFNDCNKVQSVIDYSVEEINSDTILKYSVYEASKLDFVKFIKQDDNNVSNNIKTPLSTSTCTVKLKGSISSNIDNIKGVTHAITKPNSLSVSKITPVLTNPILETNVLNTIQVPSPQLNYYIKKSPFIIKNSYDSDIVASSQYIFPKKEMLHDTLIYPDKLVCIIGSTLNNIATYKVFSLPSLEIIESGSDVRLNVNKKLGLHRSNIVGPNAIQTKSKPTDADYTQCKVVNGFRILNSDIYDIYMNTIRISDNMQLRYTSFYIGSHKINMYV